MHYLMERAIRMVAVVARCYWFESHAERELWNVLTLPNKAYFLDCYYTMFVFFAIEIELTSAAATPVGAGADEYSK